MTPKQARRREQMYSESEVRGLARALRIERTMRKLYAQRLASIMTTSQWTEFKEICQVQSMARCHDNNLANVTAKAGDA